MMSTFPCFRDTWSSSRATLAFPESSSDAAPKTSGSGGETFSAAYDKPASLGMRSRP